MKNLKVIAAIQSAASKSTRKLTKHAPEIALVIGIGGVIAGTIMACAATPKAKEALNAHKECMDEINEKVEKEEIEVAEARKSKFQTYTRTVLEMGKIYGPAFVVETLGVTSILYSHNIMQRRQVQLAASYAAVDQGFKEYRKRVAEKYGEDSEQAIYYNAKQEKVQTTVMDENGKTKTKKETVNVIDEDSVLNHPYAKIFDASADAYEDNPYYNQETIRSIQKKWNRELRTRYSRDKGPTGHGVGVVFLNEIYRDLGISVKRFADGQVIGWYMTEDHQPKIDLGYLSIKENARFADGLEPVCWIDPNVDGYVLDKM